MKVQKLLSSEDKWTQEALAKDKDGELIEYNSPNAVKWCLLGAIYKCYLSKENEITDEIISRIRNATQEPLSRFNDTHTYEEVMELVRKLDL